MRTDKRWSQKSTKLILIVAAVITVSLVLVANLQGKQTGNSYFVDSTHPDASDDAEGTKDHPWKSLNAFLGRNFLPGDTIYFAANSTYTGAFSLESSGTEKRPITITSYGSGDKPSFSNPEELNILTIRGSNIVVDGLNFTDTAVIQGWTSHTYMNSGAILIPQDSDYVTVRNSEFSAVGVGVKTYGLYTKILHNYFHDLVIAYWDDEQSYGAIGISVNHSETEIAYNNFVNCRSTDSPYGADGGAIEIEGYINDKENINIHHNRSVGSQGFIEVTESIARNVTVSQNLSDDYQQFIAFDTTVTPYNFKVEHNTIVRTKNSNVTTLFTILFYREEGPVPDNSWLSITNNIFYTPTAKVLNGSYTYQAHDFPHKYNVFYDGTSDPVGYPLGEGDIVADPLFVDLEGGNYHLKEGSPAIKAGTNLGYKDDLEGTPMPKGKLSDAGAYQYK